MVRGNDLVAFDDVELGGIFAVANKHSIDAGRKLLAAVYCKKQNIVTVYISTIRLCCV